MDHDEASEVISKEAAIAAATAASWAKRVATCGHRGCEEHEGDGPERYIHSFLGGFGADHTLDGAIDNIRAAERVGWSPNIFGHELTVITSQGKIYRYDARRPEVSDAAH